MPFIDTEIDGLLIFEPTVHKDERGYFYESFNARLYEERGITIPFVQDNQSRSIRGVLRGLHYQLDPHAQSKLVRVIQGEVLDVAVDLRKGSRTFGKYYSLRMSAENKLQMFIPRGFAHGYVVLSETAEFFYKCDGYYNKGAERGIAFNDATLDIDWQYPAHEAIISDKDKVNPSFKDAEYNFVYTGKEL